MRKVQYAISLDPTLHEKAREISKTRYGAINVSRLIGELLASAEIQATKKPVLVSWQGKEAEVYVEIKKDLSHMAHEALWKAWELHDFPRPNAIQDSPHTVGVSWHGRDENLVMATVL